MVHNKGNFEKVPGHNFFMLSQKIHTSIWFVYLKFYESHLRICDPSYRRNQPAV